MKPTPKDAPASTSQNSSRRELLRSAAFLGGCGLLYGGIGAVFSKVAYAAKQEQGGNGPYRHNNPESLIYSACLQCHTACSIKCKVVDGVLVKIDGNPWCPQQRLEVVPYDQPPAAGAVVEGRICPKGQAGIETLYDPHRIRKVLKRKPGTARGAGQWVTIPFSQAITEIVKGGNLFGEGQVDGLEAIYALKDRAVAKALAADVGALKKGEMTLAEFKQKNAAQLDKLIDPDHPDFGPKNNQFVFLAGRIEHGRKELMKWFTNASFGSLNVFEHTTICEQSHHIAYSQVTNQWKGGKWQKGKHHMKPDIANSRFVIFFGTGFTEANFGPPLLSGLVSNATVDHGFKYAVVDPRLSRSAGKARWWVPIKPGADGAFAMGMIRWMIENKRYDARYLTNANKAAAAADGETSWSSAPLLVKIEDGRPARYLRASDVGLGTDQQFVVSKGGQLVMVDVNDAANAVEGDLDGRVATEDVQAKSAFMLLTERANELTLAEYAKRSGVKVETIVELAREFTSYGKLAAAEFYRGPVQHSNGYYNAQALVTLNVLIGNSGHKGGLTAGGGHWHEYGGKPGNPHQFKKIHADAFPAFGVRSNREKARYEDSLLFSEASYPAKRPWYPYTGNLYQEVIPSAGDGYPYPIKALLLHKGTPVLSCPAGHKLIDILRDTKKIPLFIVCDIVVGETSMYADYIFPDTAVWERWATPHTTPAMLTAVSKVRQPAVAPLTETVTVDGVQMPTNLEAFLIATAKQLGLPGFGAGAFGAGKAFDHQDDWYLKLVANIAAGDKQGDTVAAADAAEVELFRKARAHLPKHVFDEARWKKAAGPEIWPHAITVLNRGGRFEPLSHAYKGNGQAHAFKGMFLLFVEAVAKGKNSLSGKFFDGLPRVEDATLADGSTLAKPGEYPLHLITHKEMFGGHSRTTPPDRWLTELIPENGVLMNRVDAVKLGLKNGDRVRVSSPTNPEGSFDLRDGRTQKVEGKLIVIEGMRPGVVTVSAHFGHWAYGSNDVTVDGQVVKGNPARSRGMTANSVMAEDTVAKNVCLTDPIGGSASFYDTPVRVQKV